MHIEKIFLTSKLPIGMDIISVIAMAQRRLLYDAIDTARELLDTMIDEHHSSRTSSHTRHWTNLTYADYIPRLTYINNCGSYIAAMILNDVSDELDVCGVPCFHYQRKYWIGRAYARLDYYVRLSYLGNVLTNIEIEG